MQGSKPQEQGINNSAAKQIKPVFRITKIDDIKKEREENKQAEKEATWTEQEQLRFIEGISR